MSRFDDLICPVWYQSMQKGIDLQLEAFDQALNLLDLSKARLIN